MISPIRLGHSTTDPYENLYTVVRGTKHFTLLPPTEGFLLAERQYPRAVYSRRSSSDGVNSGGDKGPLELVPIQDHRGVQTEIGGDQEVTPSSSYSDAGTDEDSDVDFDPNMVSWASIDPHHTDVTPSTSTATSKELEDFLKYARPIHVTLHEGETLYLPSGWWHHVSQSSHSHSQHPHHSTAPAERGVVDGDEEEKRGVCIALNWWYDMEMRGDRWVWLSALRRMGQERARE